MIQTLLQYYTTHGIFDYKTFCRILTAKQNDNPFPLGYARILCRISLHEYMIEYTFELCKDCKAVEKTVLVLHKRLNI